jgi:hypothetical protein
LRFNSREFGTPDIMSETEREIRMKVLGNITALFVALTIMVGLIFAQRSYQNSWREPTTIQSSAATAITAPTLDRAGQYKVVMK